MALPTGAHISKGTPGGAACQSRAGYHARDLKPVAACCGELGRLKHDVRRQSRKNMDTASQLRGQYNTVFQRLTSPKTLLQHLQLSQHLLLGKYNRLYDIPRLTRYGSLQASNTTTVKLPHSCAAKQRTYRKPKPLSFFVHVFTTCFDPVSFF